MGSFNVYETVKKQKEEAKKTNSYVGVLDQLRIENAQIKAPEMLEKYKTLMGSASSLLSDYNSRFFDKDGNFITSYRKDAEDSLNKYSSTKEKYESEITELRNFFNIYGKYLDSKTVSDITSSLDAYGEGLNNMFSTYQSDHEMMSKYKDEEDYNQKVVIPKKQNEEWAAADTKALETEIGDLEGKYNSYIGLKTKRDDLYSTIVSGYMRGGYTKEKAEQVALNDGRIAKYDEELSQYGDMSNAAKSLSDKKQFYNNATRVQEGIALHDNAKNAEDFDEYSKTGADIPNPTFEDVSGHFWLPSGVKKIKNKVTYSRENYDEALDEEIKAAQGQPNVTKYGINPLYTQMNEEEVAIYNYYLAKEGEEKADQFLESITETLNYREAEADFEKIKDSAILEGLVALSAGINQWGSGVKALFNTDGEYVPQSSTQMLSALVREDVADDYGIIGQGAYDLLNTTGNMLPSILMAKFTGGLLAGAGYVNAAGQLTKGASAVTKLAGAATLGGSAAGNAYQEMLNLGYDKNQAQAYGTLVGLSEASLEYLIGGITSLGGKVSGGITNKIVTKLVSNVDNAIAKVAIGAGGKLVGNMLSEFGEEYLQEVLDPVFKNITLHTDEDIKLFSTEALYSGILGALSAGLLEGGSSISSEVSIYKTGKDVKKTGQLSNLKKLGTSYSADTVAYKIASQVNENTDAYTIGQLLHEVGADSLSEANIAEITKSLERKGIAPEQARTIAKWLNSAVMGENFSPLQRLALKNPDISQTFKDVIINQNSTVNQRMQGYTDILQNIANEKANIEANKTNAKAVKKAEKAKAKAENKGTQVSTTDETKTDSTTPFVPLSNEAITSSKIEAMAKELESKGVSPKLAQVMAEREVLNSVEGKSVVDTKNVIENKFETNLDGQTLNTKTGDSVKVSEIASIDNGKMTLKLDNGETVDAENISFGSKDEAIIYSAVLDMGVNAAVANSLVKNYNPSDKLSANRYALGIKEAYKYGSYGMPINEISKKGFAADLSEAQRTHAYNLGKADTAAKVEKAQKEVEKVVSGKGGFEGKVHFNGDTLALKEVQRESLKRMGVLSDVLGVDFHVFESYVDKNGNRVYKDTDGKIKKAPNGYYKNGKIYIDLNAGAKGEGVMIYTVAHELTHFIKEWSPAKFKVLADFLMEQYDKEGQNVNDLVQAQIEKAKRNNREIGYDEAYEEVIADSMETMLSDDAVYEKILELKSKDENIVKKIGEFFAKIIDSFKKLMQQYPPETPEGKLVADMHDFFSKLQELFAEALVDAGNNFQANKGQKNTTSEGDVKLQAREVDSNGNEYWQIESNKDIFKGIKSTKALKNAAYNYILHGDKGNKIVGLIDGQNLEFIRVSAKEYVYGTQSQNLSEEAYKQKMRMSTSIIDLVENANINYDAPDHKNHKLFPNGFKNYQGRVGIDDTIFRYIVRVGKAKNGMIFYDISLEVDGKVPRANRTSLIKSSTSKDSISQTSKKSQEKLSDRDNLGNVLTEAQQSYFAESKVRDENGNLLVCYHGTDADFNTFDYNFISQDNKLGFGFYFMAGKKLQYSYKNPLKTYLNITNPLTDTSKKFSKEALSEFCDNLGIKFDYDSADYDLDVYERLSYSYTGKTENFLKAVIDILGVDGIISENRSVAVAFSPEQIKLTTNTNPTSNPDIRFSDREVQYTYNNLVSKPDMVITKLAEDISLSRAEIIREAKKNATVIGKKHNDGSISVLVDDIDTDVVISTDSIKHSLDRRIKVNGPVMLQIGKILKNSIKINELNPREDNIKKTYVLIGVAQNTNNEPYVVSFVVNSHTNKIDTVDVLYSANAKKETAVLNAPRDSTPSTVSTISISDLLKYVNKYFPDILPSDVLKHFGYSERPKGKLGENALFQYRDAETSANNEKVNQQLAKENVKLMEDVKYLKELVKLQSKETHGKMLKKSTVELVAKRLMAYSNAKGNVSELVNHLTDVYSFIAQGEDVSWDAIKEKSQAAVDWLMQNENHKQVRDEYADTILKELRTMRVSLDAAQKAEVEHLYGSVNDFRKKNMGRIIITNDGISLDSVWQELAENHPMYFDKDVNSADQPIILMDIIDGLQNTYSEDEYHYYSDEMIAQDLMTKVYEGYWDVSALHTVADSKAKEINLLKAKHKESMEELKKAHAEGEAKLRQEHKDRISELRTQYREREEAKIQKVAKKYQESREKAVESRNKTVVRGMIKRTVNDLDKLLNRGTKERNVKAGLRDTVSQALATAEILFTNNISNDEIIRNGVEFATPEDRKLINDYEKLLEQRDVYIAKIDSLGYKKGLEVSDKISEFYDMIDRIDGKISVLNGKLKKVFEIERARINESKMSTALTALSDAYESIKTSEYDYIRNAYDDYVKTRIDALKNRKDSGTAIKDMNLLQLREVYDVFNMVKHTITIANESFDQELKMSRQELGVHTYNEIKTNNKVRSRIPLQAIEKFGWQNLKPIQAMKTIGSETLQKLWNNILYGQEVFAKDFDEAVKFAESIKEKYKYDKWDLIKQYSFKSKSGKVMKINLEQMMSIYAYSKRAQADEHIEKGGILLNEAIIKEKNKLGKTVKVRVNDATAYRLDKMQIGEIITTLENVAPGAKGFVDEMQKYLSETMGAKGNEVSMKMYGIEIFKEKHYFPLKSSKEFMEAANQKLKGDVKIKNKGMTKSVVEHAQNPIVLEGFLDVWGNHINEMAMYHGLVLPLEDFSRTLNYGFKADEGLNTDAESVRSALHNVFGDSADNYLNELIKAINGGILHDSSAEFADKMISKFKKAKVMASLSVIVQQPTAIIRAMGIIEPKYFTSQNFHHKQTWEELKKHCPTAIIKEAGSFDTNMGKTIVEMIKDEQGFTDKVGDFLGKAPAWMDELGWNMIWRALKKKVATEQNLSGEELLKECGKQMTLIINETQVYDSVMSRNELMRSKNTFTKMATSFMAEPSTVINMIWGSALDFKRGNKSLATKTVAATISSIVVNALVSALVYAFRDDDEEKTWLEKYVSSATSEIAEGLNPITYIPFVKDIYSVFQGYDVERTDLALVADIKSAVDDFYKVFDFDAYEDMEGGEITSYLYENIKPLITSICDMFGLPVGNVLRDVEPIFVNDNLPMSRSTGVGFGLAIKEGILNSRPELYSKIWGDEKYHKLYLLANQGNTQYVKEDVQRLIDKKVNEGKDKDKAKTAVRSSFTAIYKDNYQKAVKNKDYYEMNRIRKFLYATGLYGTLSELDETLKKWRTAE